MLREIIFDIEVKTNGLFPFPERAEHEINAITIYDNFTDHYITIITDLSRFGQVNKKDNWHIYYTKDERTLLILTVKLIKFYNSDIIYGWYSENFDVPYLFNRMHNLEMKNILNNISPMNYVNQRNFSISGMHVTDLMILDKKIKKRSSYTLANVAIEENLPILKSEKHEDLEEIYKKDKDRFAFYNKSDVEVLVELNKKNKLISFFENTRTFAGLNDIRESLKNSIIVDTIALRRAYKEGFVLPSKPSKNESNESEDEDEKQGGYVKFPFPGLHKNVIVLDMAKFYPKILDLLNLSTETIVAKNLTKDQINKNDGYIYVEYEDNKYCKVRTDKRGFMSSLYNEFLKERLAVEDELKKYEINSPEYNFLMQKRQTIKDTSNSLPGTTGYSGFRLYNPIVYNSIIHTGRKMIIRTEKMISDLGLDDIYSDTDSRHIEIKKDISSEDLVKLGYELSDKFSNAYIPMVEEEFSLKCDSAFEIEFEKMFKTIIYIQKDDGKPAKKRYAAREGWEKGKYVDVLYVRGFDMRRSDASNYCKNLQEQVLRMILWDKPREDTINYIQNMIDGFKEASLEDISIPKGINKPIESYGKIGKSGKKGNIPAQISGAIYSNMNFNTNFGMGSKIKYFYVNRMSQGYPSTNIISFDDINKLPEGIEINYEKMIDANIKKKIERILLAAGINWNEIQGQKSLFDF